MMRSDSLQPPHPERLTRPSIALEIDTERSIDIRLLAHAPVAGLVGFRLVALTGC